MRYRYNTSKYPWMVSIGVFKGQTDYQLIPKSVVNIGYRKSKSKKMVFFSNVWTTPKFFQEHSKMLIYSRD